jgi:hypothetical protein
MDAGAELDNLVEQVGRLLELWDRYGEVRKYNPHSDLSDMERTLRSARGRIASEVKRIRTARRYPDTLFNDPEATDGEAKEQQGRQAAEGQAEEEGRAAADGVHAGPQDAEEVGG